MRLFNGSIIEMTIYARLGWYLILLSNFWITQINGFTHSSKYCTDQIALPDFNAGAMENWGLITYRETALLYDKEMSSNGNKESIVSIIAHELAHQVQSRVPFSNLNHKYEMLYRSYFYQLHNYKVDIPCNSPVYHLPLFLVVWKPCDYQVVEWSVAQWRFCILRRISWGRWSWAGLEHRECLKQKPRAIKGKC